MPLTPPPRSAPARIVPSTASTTGKPCVICPARIIEQSASIEPIERSTAPVVSRNVVPIASSRLIEAPLRTFVRLSLVRKMLWVIESTITITSSTVPTPVHVGARAISSPQSSRNARRPSPGAGAAAVSSLTAAPPPDSSAANRRAALLERDPLADAVLVPAHHRDRDLARDLHAGVDLGADLRAEVADLQLVGLVRGRDQAALDGVDPLLRPVDPEDHQLQPARLRGQPGADRRVVVEAEHDLGVGVLGQQVVRERAGVVDVVLQVVLL